MTKLRRKDWTAIATGFFVLISNTTIWFWLENNLPVPPRAWNHLHSKNESGMFDFVIGTRNDVIRKNFRKRASQLTLDGTRWLDHDTGAILEFGSDRVIRWIKRPALPSTTDTRSKTDPLVEEWLHESSYAFDRVDADNFTWEADSLSHSVSGNLHIPDSGEFQAGMGFDGKTLGLWAVGPNSNEPKSAPRDPFGPDFSPRLYLWFEEKLP